MQSACIDNGERPRSSHRRCAAKRTVFTRYQLLRMEERFSCQTFLSKEERKQFAGELCLGERQIMIWFQNRRGRLKRRGPSDKAYTASKLEELTNRRPYPYIPCGQIAPPSSPAKPRTTARDAAWPVCRSPFNVTNCPAVTPRQDAIHPNINTFPPMTPVATLGNYSAGPRARQWVPCMVTKNQQHIRHAYNTQPYYNPTSWSCNALRPNNARFDARQNPTNGRTNTDPPRNMALPACTPGNTTNLTVAGSCNDVRQQTAEMTYFSSEPPTAVAQPGYSQDCFGVGLNELIHVW